MKYEKLVPLPTAPLLLGLLLALACVATGCNNRDSDANIAQPGSAVPGSKKSESIDLGGGVRMEFVLIPAGSFTIGSDTGQPEKSPVHKVTLTKPFYLGKFEVTQEQWQSVMGSNPSSFKGPKLPVESVSWDDCQSFLTKLQKKTRRKFALPTEAPGFFSVDGSCWQ